MIRTKSYTIDLPPLSWKRCELSGRQFFDGQKKEKVIFGLSMRRSHGNDPIFAKPVMFHNATFFFPFPKSRHKCEEDDFYVGRCDIDNLVKFIFDAAVDAEILIDDNIICAMGRIKKVYSHHPRTDFSFTELPKSSIGFNF